MFKLKEIEKTNTRIFKPKLKKYISILSGKFIYKKVNIPMEIKEEEEEEIPKEKEKKDMEVDDIYRGPGSSFSAFIKLDEKERLGEKEKELLTFKRNRRKGRKILGDAKTVKKIQPSTAQQLFNILGKKEMIDEGAVRSAADEAKFGTKLSKEMIDFFISLGKARVSLKKLGIPGTLCRNPFHLFKSFVPYDITQIFTNDSNAINCYFWMLFGKNVAENGLKEYTQMCKESKIKSFSIVTDKTFLCNSVLSGYVQDYSKKISIICPRALNEQEIKDFAKSIEGKEVGSILATIANPSGDNVVYFLQYKELLVISPTEINVNNVLAETAKVKCVNSKNNLQAGLKEVKIDTSLGNYLNVHDIKPTDFSPSCLFISPAVASAKMFIDVELETNSVYFSLSQQMKSVKKLEELSIPENAIFWDNIDSAIQMFGFIRLIDKPNDDVEADLIYVITKYQEYRNNFSAWKHLYSNFEAIVLTFYDKITNKLTIDNITTLTPKVSKFISDYNNERTNSGPFDAISRIMGLLPGAKLMKNFVTTPLAIELIYAIARLIAILKDMKTSEGEYSISDLFKTIGLTCSNVLYDGSFAMIPKIRSKSAFIGGLMTDMSKVEYDKNIDYLVSTYKKSYVAGLKEEVKVEDLNNMDDLVKIVIENTIKAGDSEYLKENVEAITGKVMADSKLLGSLREDIKALLLNNTIDQIRANGTFIADDLFMGFLKTFNEMNKAIEDAGGNAEPEEIAAMVKIDEGAKKDKASINKFTKKLGELARKKMLFKVEEINIPKKKVKVRKKKLKKIVNKQGDKSKGVEENVKKVIGENIVVEA